MNCSPCKGAFGNENCSLRGKIKCFFYLKLIIFILEPITCKVPTENRDGILCMGQPVGQYFHFPPVDVMVLKVTDDDSGRGKQTG